MTLKPLFQSKKKATAEAKPQETSLGYSVADKMKLIISTIDTKVLLLNKTFSKAEQHVFEKKKVLMLNTPEYEALCKMLNSLRVLSDQGIKTADNILLLLDSDYELPGK